MRLHAPRLHRQDLLSGSDVDESDESPRGFEFRAPYKGLYFLEAKDRSVEHGYDNWPQTYHTLVSGDCPASVPTHCVITPGIPKTGDLPTTNDGDDFRTPLQAGHTYHARLTYQPSGCWLGLYVSDPNSHLVGEMVGDNIDILVSSPRDGLYYLSVTNESYLGCPYTLSVTDSAVARH